MPEKMSITMVIESYEQCNLESQVRRNVKAAIESENPAYRCVRIAVRTAKKLGGRD